jgi:hypothetical protein
VPRTRFLATRAVARVLFWYRDDDAKAPGCTPMRRPNRLECQGGVAYDLSMDTLPPRVSSLPDEAEVPRQRLLVAAHLQAIEGNPLDAEDLAMFEMFEREGWPQERRRAYVLAQAAKLAAE